MTDATKGVPLRVADPQKPAKRANAVNNGYESPIRDIGF
jgi:hypothetical protein